MSKESPLRRPDLHVGERWAYREKPHTTKCPIMPVEIVQLGPPRSNKVRIRFLGGEYPGLDMWVPKVRLRVPWTEADAWLRDERLFAAAVGTSMAALDSAAYHAAWIVLGAYPRPDGILLGTGSTEGATVRIPDLATVARDLELDADQLLAKPLAFLDRHGEYVAPWTVAERLVRRVAEVHTEKVLAEVDAEERRLQDEAVHGSTFDWGKGLTGKIPAEKCAEYLRERQPVFDLVRSWCGQSAVERFNELAALRTEVARLRGLVDDAARQFEEIGHPRLSRRMREQLEPTSTSRRLRSGPAGASEQTREPTDRAPT